MQNAAIAQIFNDIADFLELAGENVFKIRAYRRAGEAIATHPEPIEDAAENGNLNDIEGLGTATIAKTKEYLATGKVQELERLREEYPPGLLELLRVPGLGPKRIGQLYKERGISSVESLRDAIAKGEMKGISGFGPKTIANIEAGLNRLAETGTQIPLWDALRASASLKVLSERIDGVLDVAVAGDARRGCDLADDVSVVAKSSQPDKSVAAMSALPPILNQQEVVNYDSAVVIPARMAPGVDVKLGAAEKESFGALLMFATGSTKHWQEAQQRAQKLGLELRPDGLWKDRKRVAGESEEEIYQALGAEFIPPELREARGEWELDKRVLTNLITSQHIRGDLHAHSTWSDGTATIRQMVQAAKARGYQYHAVTDHSKALVMTNGLDARRLREQAKEIEEVQAEFPDVKILRGVECDILRDGTMDLDDDILHELDLVIASVHSGFRMAQAAQTERMIKAIQHPAVDIVAHPTGRIVGGRPGYEVDIDAIIDAAAETGTALEINASERLDLRDEHAHKAREKGVLISIDTDAHSTRMLNNLDLGIVTARRAWCQPQDILNTKSTDELLRWLKDRQ